MKLDQMIRGNRRVYPIATDAPSKKSAVYPSQDQPKSATRILPTEEPLSDETSELNAPRSEPSPPASSPSSLPPVQSSAPPLFPPITPKTTSSTPELNPPMRPRTGPQIRSHSATPSNTSAESSASTGPPQPKAAFAASETAEPAIGVRGLLNRAKTNRGNETNVVVMEVSAPTERGNEGDDEMALGSRVSLGSTSRAPRRAQGSTPRLNVHPFGLADEA